MCRPCSDYDTEYTVNGLGGGVILSTSAVTLSRDDDLPQGQFPFNLPPKITYRGPYNTPACPSIYCVRTGSSYPGSGTGTGTDRPSRKSPSSRRIDRITRARRIGKYGCSRCRRRSISRLALASGLVLFRSTRAPGFRPTERQTGFGWKADHHTMGNVSGYKATTVTRRVYRVFIPAQVCRVILNPDPLRVDTITDGWMGGNVHD